MVFCLLLAAVICEYALLYALFQILTQMYVNRRMIVEADSVVRSCLQLARSHR